MFSQWEGYISRWKFLIEYVLGILKIFFLHCFVRWKLLTLYVDIYFKKKVMRIHDLNYHPLHRLDHSLRFPEFFQNVSFQKAYGHSMYLVYTVTDLAMCIYVSLCLLITGIDLVTYIGTYVKKMLKVSAKNQIKQSMYIYH